MRIIPAIDIIDGKCVRLSKGDYTTKKVYSENPVDIAKTFEDYGFQYLHLVDLDGAKNDHIVNYKCLEQIVSKTDLKVDFGGGIKSDKAIEIAFECGANQVTIGSVAVKSPQIFHRWIDRYGGSKIILGADIRNGKIAVQGWLETSQESAIQFIEAKYNRGVKYVICTDIEKDGMLGGPSVSLYENILKSTSDIKLIASGGISSIHDIHLLETIGCEGVIIGKAIYENRISMRDLETFLL